MPALVDSPFVFWDVEKTPVGLQDTTDNIEDTDCLKSTPSNEETLIITNGASLVRRIGQGTDIVDLTEGKDIGETKAAVTEKSDGSHHEEVKMVTETNTTKKCHEETNELTTSLEHDDSDSDISSMTTGTPPISCGEDEDLQPPWTRPVHDVMDVEVKFDERDVLDLAANLSSKSWNLRPAVLPPMNLHMFWQNRAQYHRLGNYGTEACNMINCLYCGFQYILPK